MFTNNHVICREIELGLFPKISFEPCFGYIFVATSRFFSLLSLSLLILFNLYVECVHQFYYKQLPLTGILCEKFNDIQGFNLCFVNNKEVVNKNKFKYDKSHEVSPLSTLPFNIPRSI